MSFLPCNRQCQNTTGRRFSTTLCVASRVDTHLLVVTMPLTIDKELVLMRTNGQVYDGEEVMATEHTITHTHFPIIRLAIE